MKASFAILALSLSLFSALAYAKSPKTFETQNNSGFGSLTVTFDASALHDHKHAEKFFWTFGDGNILTTSEPVVNYTYRTVGSYTATLKYLKNKQDKPEIAKDGGSVLITVEQRPNLPPVTTLDCQQNFLLMTCNTFGSYDPEGLGLTYHIEYGDGTSEFSTTGLFSHAYSLPGPYTVSLTAYDLSGLNTTIAREIIAIKPPNKMPTAELACSTPTPQTMSCSAIGSKDEDGEIFNYKYEWDDGAVETTSSALEISHKFTSAGEHSVRLTVTDNEGGTAFVEKTIVLKNNTPPVADFTCTKTGIQKLHCESTSADIDGSIVSTIWDLDDGIDYFTSVIDHSFGEEDFSQSHLITLTVKDDLGLENTISKNIQVDLEPLVSPPQVFFKSFIIEKSVQVNSTITPTQYRIKEAYYKVFDQGALSPSQTIPVTEFYPNTMARINFEQYGTYRIELTAIDIRGQITTYTHRVSVVEEPLELSPFIDFRAIQSGPNQIFLNMNPSFAYDYDETIEVLRIDWGDGFTQDVINDVYATHTYSAPGTFNISVYGRTSSKTFATRTRSVIVNANNIGPVAPIAAFGYRIYDFAQNVTFYNERSGTPNGQIVTYEWDFGDGQTGTGERAAHFYHPGDYLVTLKVTDSIGLTSSQTQHIKILSAGTDIVANIECGLSEPYVQFAQKCRVFALDKYNDISRIRVVWGDGTAFNLMTPYIPEQGIYLPLKTYQSPGNYIIRLIVSTNRGEIKTAETQLSLSHLPPVAQLNCSANNLLVHCNALTSYDPKGTQLTYKFEYSDGFTETNNTGLSSHPFAEAGLQSIKVTINDIYGITASANANVQTMIPPNLPPVPKISCWTEKPLRIKCNARESYDSDGQVFVANYQFDDGTQYAFAPDHTFEHAFNSAGLHTIKLSVTDNDGASTAEMFTYNILDNQAPQISLFCQSTQINTLDCNLDAHDPDGTIVSREWYFNGELSTFDSFSISKIFPEPLFVQVQVKAIDDLGKTSTVTTDVHLKANLAPIADVSCVSSLPLQLNCISLSYDPEQFPLSYSWKIENEVVSNDEIFFYSFQEGGFKKIELIITDFHGTTSTKDLSIYVIENKKPIAIANCTSEIKFRIDCNANGSNDEDGFITNYKWTIDNQILYGQSVILQLSDGGIKNITLEVTDNYGQTSIAQTQISFNAPSADFECIKIAGYKYSCAASEVNDETVYNRFVLNEEKIFEGKEVEIDFPAPGNHTLRYKVISKYGEEFSYVKDILVPEEYLPPLSSFKAYSIINWSYKLDATKSLSQGRKVKKFNWKINGQNFSTSEAITIHDFQIAGDATIELQVEDDVGNTNISIQKIIVYFNDIEYPQDDSSVEGIDADQNGIRDDVQYWINLEAKNNNTLRELMIKLAKTWEASIKTTVMSSDVKPSIILRKRTAKCLDQAINQESISDRIQTTMEYLYFKSPERYMIREKIYYEYAGLENIYKNNEELNCAQL